MKIEDYFNQITDISYIQEWLADEPVTQESAVESIIDAFPLPDNLCAEDVADWVEREVSAHNDMCAYDDISFLLPCRVVEPSNTINANMTQKEYDECCRLIVASCDEMRHLRMLPASNWKADDSFFALDRTISPEKQKEMTISAAKKRYKTLLRDFGELMVFGDTDQMGIG